MIICGKVAHIDMYKIVFAPQSRSAFGLNNDAIEPKNTNKNNDKPI